MPQSLIPRAHLFGNPTKTFATISPDGRQLAWLAPLDGVLNISVAPVDALDEARPITNDRKRGIHNFRWTYQDNHIVYMQDENGDENFHVYSVNALTGTVRDLTPFDGVSAWIWQVSRTSRDRIAVGMNKRDRRFHDLYSVDILTGELALLQENQGFAFFLCDRGFNVHLAVRNTPDGAKEILRRAEGAWTPWIAFAPEDAWTSNPGHLDATAKTLFLYDSRERDKAALTRVDLETGEIKLLAEHHAADVGHLLIDENTLEPLAYTVTVERLEYFAIDPSVQPDLDFLNEQRIGDWAVSSRTEDDKLWTIRAQSDTRPFIEYLYDRDAKTLRLLHHARPELAGAPLLRMQPVKIRSRDGLGLVSYLTLPKEAVAKAPQPMVLLVHGGPWGRDMFGFHPLHQWLANRGYAVLSVNFRGSTGFGKAFINAGDQEWGRRMDDDLLDAVEWAVNQGVADARRIAIMGGSYGGYATLVGLTRNPDRYACGVDIFGPSNLETLIRTIPAYWESFRSQLIKAIGDPETEEGLRLLRERSPLYRADQLAKPLLIAQGANDPRVKPAESEQMVKALKQSGLSVTYLFYPDEGHGFARPENNIAFFAVGEHFLARHIGGRAEPIHVDELESSSLEVKEGAGELPLPE
jgi:dipeptidyl aminopeptidase/acylaminoacyl peptidase